MEACRIVGTVVFAITLLLSLLWLVGAALKRVGVTGFGPVGWLLYIAVPCFCFWLEKGIFDSAPHAWAVAIIPIVLNLYFLFLQYILLVGSMILGEKHIYRIGHGFVIKKYTFSEIQKCSGSDSSGTVASRVSRRKVKSFDITVRFSDGTQGSFSTKQKDSPKARYYLETIKAKRKK